MAWRCSGSSNTELIANLARNGFLPPHPSLDSDDSPGSAVDPRAQTAFLRVDRAHYAPSDPYADHPQVIGHGATISAPHMHAVAVKFLWRHLESAGRNEVSSDTDEVPQTNGILTNGLSSPETGTPNGTLVLSTPRPSPPPDPRLTRRPIRILDIGAGSGYLTHVFGEIVSALGGPGSLVVGVEHHPALRDLAEANMRASAAGRALLDSGTVALVAADGRLGAPLRFLGDDADHNKWAFDTIHVGAAADGVPAALVGQLRAPGRMFIPVEEQRTDDGLATDARGRPLQYIWLVDKDGEGHTTEQRLLGVRYVPLTDMKDEDAGSLPESG